MNKHETDANYDQGGDISWAWGTSKPDESIALLCQTVCILVNTIKILFHSHTQQMSLYLL